MKQPNDPRQGSRWTKATQDFRARCKATNAPCWLCHQPINYHTQGRTADSLEVDHLYPVTLRPDLAYDPACWRPSHSSCNHSRGNTMPVPKQWTTADW